jgi:hypothetical protein
MLPVAWAGSGQTPARLGAVGDGDNDTPWVLYVGLVAGGVAVVALTYRL